MVSASARMMADGRVEFPLAIRRAVGLEHGGDVVIEVANNELHLRLAVASNRTSSTPPVALDINERVKRLQAMSAELLKGRPDFSVDDFIAEKRRETAEQEAKEAARGYP